MASCSAEIAEDTCNNSADEDDGDDVVGAETRKLFRIDTNKIESVPHCQQNAELQDLDLHVYNQDTFEQGKWLDIAYLC